MKKTKEEQLALLNDTIAHYSENVNRRCVAIDSNGQIQCKYSGTTINNTESDGCAIGRLLTPELRLMLDNNCGDTIPSGVDNVWGDLPDEIKAYGQAFLITLQKLHDEPSYWGSEGLTERGQSCVDRIKVDISLDL